MSAAGRENSDGVGTRRQGYRTLSTLSPEGRSIAYVVDSSLRRLEISGGSPQVLTSVPAGLIPAWSSAGIILFTTRGGLFQIPASGGEAKPAMASGAAGYFPSFLPDGRRFLYGAGFESAPGIYLGSLDSKEGKRITAGSSGVFVPPSWLLYIRGSALVAQSFDVGKQSLSGDPIPIADQVAIVGPGGAFSVSQNGVLAYRRTPQPLANDLTWYDRQGKRLGTVGEQAVYTNPALSPDGKRLAISRRDPGTTTRNIWVLDLARGVSSRFTFDKADETNPLWSPDGSRIAYSSARRGPNFRDIFWKASGGAAGEEPLVEDAGTKAVEDWSADGKLVLYNVGNRTPTPSRSAVIANPTRC